MTRRRPRRSFAAPRTIRRIAARRVYTGPRGRQVVLTIGVPRPVPGSDWGCPLQITGIPSEFRRPRYVFGIDGLQALHLAMEGAGLVLESCGLELAFLGQTDELFMPKFLPDAPWLPKASHARIKAVVDRELERFVTAAERRQARAAARRQEHSKRSRC